MWIVKCKMHESVQVLLTESENDVQTNTIFLFKGKTNKSH